jgi:hypothetical protein
MKMKRTLILCLVVRAAFAAPTVTVSAKTRLTIDEVARGGAGVHVRGALADAGTSEGIAGRTVVVKTQAGAALATTTQSGRFDAVLALPAGEHQIAVQFAGDDTFGAAHAEGSYGVGRGTLKLGLVAQGAEASGEGIAVVVDASAAGVPESLRVSLRVDDRPAGDLETGQDGQGETILPRGGLGAPGEKRITARFAGSPQLNPAEASATALLTTSTRIAELDAPDRPVPFERDVAVRGRLVDDDGAAVPGALVSLARGDNITETTTDDKGAFDLRLAASALGPGPAALTVEHVSRVPWRRGTRVGPLSVVVLAPRPLPLTGPLGALAATGLAVIAYVLLRTRPWERLLSRWRRRRRKPEAAPPPELAAEDAVAPGLKLARPGLISTLRRPTDFGFTGRVSDAVRGQAIPAARLEATCGDQTVTAEADAAGHFELTLGAGLWRVEVVARGYLREQVTAPIPHRGELRGARVDLVPVRERVFAIYREVVAPLLPSVELWGVWTPREILDHVREGGAAGALAAFTTFVEETYFSAALPDEGAIGRAMEGAWAARREREDVDRDRAAT